MRYATFPAPPHLANHIRYYWTLEGNGPYIHRSMAGTCPELVFHYKGSFGELKAGEELACARTELQGGLDHYRRFATGEDFAMFGIYLYPWALPDLFGHAAAGLADSIAGLEDVLGAAGAELTERIFEARDDRERIAIATGFSEKRLRMIGVGPSKLDRLVKGIIHQPGHFSIDARAEDFGWSRRQFERQFKARAGFSPKHFARISRFQAVLEHYKGARTNLADLAFQFGYYDQSHFSSEFKQFSGHRPRDFFHKGAEGMEWREA